MEAGQLEIHKTECELETLVSETVDALALLCVEKKLAIRATASATRLTCDPNRVQQVLGNLIGNAIKLTPEGGKITVEALASQGEVRFTVADGSPGISEEARSRVFKHYWREKDRDLPRGAGLGLFISKSIVEAHGGKIGFESADGGGSRFYFTLPLG
jgi:signal transduction histidine kinase